MKPAVALQYLLPHRFLSRLALYAARWQWKPWKNWLIDLVVRRFDVNMAEAEQPDPHAYASFGTFFTRALKPGARVADPDPRALLMPADGRISQLGVIESGRIFQAKGQSYTAAELLGDANAAAPFADGIFATVYLAPRDYHRVHAPADGNITLVRGLAGDLYPVNAIGERHVPQLFVRNQRAAIVIDTPGLGRVTVVMVGAVIVGRVTVSVLGGSDVPPGLHPIEPAVAVRRGDELGVFHLGSTVVLLLEPGLAVARKTGPIRFGESLLRAG